MSLRVDNLNAFKMTKFFNHAGCPMMHCNNLSEKKTDESGLTCILLTCICVSLGIKSKNTQNFIFLGRRHQDGELDLGIELVSFSLVMCK